MTLQLISCNLKDIVKVARPWLFSTGAFFIHFHKTWNRQSVSLENQVEFFTLRSSQNFRRLIQWWSVLWVQFPLESIFLLKLDVNSGLKCKFDRMVKNSSNFTDLVHIDDKLFNTRHIPVNTSRRRLTLKLLMYLILLGWCSLNK